MKLAKDHGFVYTECSAKTGESIDEVFRQLTLKIYEKEENLITNHLEN